MMAQIAYALGVLISIFCAGLLIRSYRRHRTPLLLWCSLCFVGLALNNVLLFTDLFLVPEVSLEMARTVTGLASLLLLLVALIWEDA
jgi:uncharacterized protein DUF5985